jgi:hypothetical protein
MSRETPQYSFSLLHAYRYRRLGKAVLQRHIEVSLQGKPLGFGSPRLLWISQSDVELADELSDELVHLDQCKILPHAYAAAHPELDSH